MGQRLSVAGTGCDQIEVGSGKWGVYGKDEKGDEKEKGRG